MIDFDVALPGLDPFVVTYQGLDMSYEVFGGGSGPAVVLLHEIDGLGEPVKGLANHLAEKGLSVHVPAFFSGPLGGLLACVRREFVCFSAGRTSPISHWIGALGEELQRRDPHKRPVGVIGMCFSGSFAHASVLAGHAVKAAVVAQPAMPWSAPTSFFRDARKRDLGLDEGDRRQLENQLHEGSAGVLPLRFDRDWRCPKLRVEEISAIDGASHVHYVSGSGHPTLTAFFRDQGNDRSLEAIELAASWLLKRLATEAS